jgi:hypothetical protein
MTAILLTLWLFVVDLFKPRSRLQTENLFLRDQLNIALRRAPSRIRLSGSDRALLVLITNCDHARTHMALQMDGSVQRNGAIIAIQEMIDSGVRGWICAKTRPTSEGAVCACSDAAGHFLVVDARFRNSRVGGLRTMLIRR